jgi:hypothetical protein
VVVAVALAVDGEIPALLRAVMTASAVLCKRRRAVATCGFGQKKEGCRDVRFWAKEGKGVEVKT